MAISQAIAGMILLPFLGCGPALLGGTWPGTLFGGLWGLTVGTVAGTVVGCPDLSFQANFCLLVGAIIGATFLSFSRHVKKWLGLVH